MRRIYILRFNDTLHFRSIVGFTIGSNTAAVTTFAMEIVPIKDRAFAMFVINVWYVMGGCYVYAMGLIFMNQFGWRIIVLLTAVPTVVSCLSSCFILESPRYLFVCGRMSELSDTLARMFKMNDKVLPKYNLGEHVEESRGSIPEIFEGDYFRVTILLLQAFTINAFIEYGAALLLPDMFVYDYCSDTSLFDDDSSCYMSNTEYLYMLLIGSVSLPAVLVAYLTCDKFGRIRTMLFSGAVTLVGLIMLLICINVYVLVGEAAVVVFFSVLQNCALWLYLPESYPTYIRNAAVGVVNGVGKLGAALGSLVTEIVAGSSIRACLTLYVCLTAYQLVCIYLMKRDTVGLRLDDTRAAARERSESQAQESG